MKYFVKKLYIAFTTLLLTSACQAFGGSSTDDSCESFCSSCNNTCGRGFVSADLLYWKVHQGGFACGCVPTVIDNCINEDGYVISKFSAHGKDPSFKWNAGFRIGAGYEFGNNCWDIAAYWTDFHTRIHDDHHCGNFHWKLNFEVIDVVISRRICLDSFTLRPYIGIRGARIDQKLNLKSQIAYDTFFNACPFNACSVASSQDCSNSILSDLLNSKEKNHQDFKGIGPLIGIEAGWNLGCGFSIYAAASVSSLYGNFKVKFSGTNTFLNGTNICDKHLHIHSCQISTDALLGIRWKQCLCGDTLLIFQFAFEQHRYFDHNHLGGHGDLCLDGISLSGGIAF